MRELLRSSQSIKKRSSCNIFLRLIVVPEKDKLGVSKTKGERENSRIGKSMDTKKQQNSRVQRVKYFKNRSLGRRSLPWRILRRRCTRGKQLVETFPLLV
jgi:hypothetical protein